MKNPNTRKRQFLAAGAGIAVILGVTSCAHTGQEGSVETQGACMPSRQTYEMSVGNEVKYGIRDLSHDDGDDFSTFAEAEDYIEVKAVGTDYTIYEPSFFIPVEEIVFTDKERQDAEIKRIGSDDNGLPYYEDLNTHRVDVDAIPYEGYEFSIREADREVEVTVVRMDEVSGTVGVTFVQDCNKLPDIN